MAFYLLCNMRVTRNYGIQNIRADAKFDTLNANKMTCRYVPRGQPNNASEKLSSLIS